MLEPDAFMQDKTNNHSLLLGVTICNMSCKLSCKEATFSRHKPFALPCSKPCAPLSVKLGFLNLDHFTHLGLGMLFAKGVSKSWAILATFK